MKEEVPLHTAGSLCVSSHAQLVHEASDAERFARLELVACDPKDIPWPDLFLRPFVYASVSRMYPSVVVVRCHESDLSVNRGKRGDYSLYFTGFCARFVVSAKTVCQELLNQSGTNNRVFVTMSLKNPVWTLGDPLRRCYVRVVDISVVGRNSALGSMPYASCADIPVHMGGTLRGRNMRYSANRKGIMGVAPYWWGMGALTGANAMGAPLGVTSTLCGGTMMGAPTGV